MHTVFISENRRRRRAGRRCSDRLGWDMFYNYFTVAWEKGNDCRSNRVANLRGVAAEAPGALPFLDVPIRFHLVFSEERPFHYASGFGDTPDIAAFGQTSSGRGSAPLPTPARTTVQGSRVCGHTHSPVTTGAAATMAHGWPRGQGSLRSVCTGRAKPVSW